MVGVFVNVLHFCVIRIDSADHSPRLMASQFYETLTGHTQELHQLRDPPDPLKNASPPRHGYCTCMHSEASWNASRPQDACFTGVRVCVCFLYRTSSVPPKSTLLREMTPPIPSPHKALSKSRAPAMSASAIHVNSMVCFECSIPLLVPLFVME